MHGLRGPGLAALAALGAASPRRTDLDPQKNWESELAPIPRPMSGTVAKALHFAGVAGHWFLPLPAKVAAEAQIFVRCIWGVPPTGWPQSVVSR